MEGQTFAVYRSIIDEVLDKVRADFQAEGVDERVIQELQMMWETKLLQTNAIAPAGVLVEEKPPPTPQNAFFATDLNYPPPPDLPVHQYIPVAPSERGGAGSGVTGREDKASTSGDNILEDHDVKRRRLSESSPLLERALDSGPSAPVPASGLLVPPAGGAVTTGVGSDALEGWRIRGGAGPDGEGDEEEDYNEEEPEKPAAEVKTEVPSAEDEEGAADEDDLNELDDEEEQKEEEEDEAEATTNIVLAQFEKVTRTKNKWKCTLKEGVIKLNGRDVLFNKANGEFVW